MSRLTAGIRPLTLLLLTLLVATSAFAWIRSRSSGGINPQLIKADGTFTFTYRTEGINSAGAVNTHAAWDAARTTVNAVATSDATANPAGADVSMPNPVACSSALTAMDSFGDNRVAGFTTNDCGLPMGVLAFAAAYHNNTTGAIATCNVFFNDVDFNWDTADMTVNPDLQGVATHEFIHCYGISHSGIVGAFNASGHEAGAAFGFGGDPALQSTMFPFHTGTTNDRTLHQDDIAALSDMYPNAQTLLDLGTISGTVQTGAAAAVTGAQVIAVSTGDPNTPVVGFFSNIDVIAGGTGAYRLLVPPGVYFVRIEPMITFTNVWSQSNIFHPVTFQNAFPPEFYSGGSENATDDMPFDTDAQMVTVTAGMTTATINFVTNTVVTPTNDLFANRITLSSDFTQAYNNTSPNTSAEGADPLITCGGGAPPEATTWYTFTAPEAGTATFSTFGSSNDTAIMAITGNPPGTLVACSDDVDFPRNWQAQVSFPMTNGQTVNFMVHDFDNGDVLVPPNTIVVNFLFVGTNAAPVAVNDAFSTGANQMLSVAAPGVLANDTDADLDPLTVSLGTVTQPANGAVVMMADGSFDYTPDMGFSGMDTFTYQATDGSALSNTATVTITVNACTRDFTAGGDATTWNDTSNWTPAGVPGSGADEIICIGGANAVTYAVADGTTNISRLIHTSSMPFTITGGMLSVATNSEVGSGGLLLTSGTFDTVGTTTINGPVMWDAGTMAGGGGNFEFLNGATLATAGIKTVSAASIFNRGSSTLNWVDGEIRLNNSSFLINEGTFESNNDDVITATAGSGFFTNSGTINKTSGGTETRIGPSVFFTNGASGSVNITSGTFNIAGDGASTGTINVPGAAFLGLGLGNFGAPTFDFNAGAQVIGGAGSGIMRLGDTNTVNFNAGSSVMIATRLGQATLNLNTGAPVTLQGVEFFDQGTINVGDPLTLNALSWDCGTFADSQTITLPNGGQMSNTACGAALRTLNGPDMINNGTMTWLVGTLQIGGGSTFTNNGAVDLQNAAGAAITDFGGGGAVVNAASGSIIRDGAGFTTVDSGITVTNEGLLEIEPVGSLFFGGVLTQNSGATRVNGSLAALTFDVNGGLVEGTGTINDDLNNTGGIIGPGLSPGILSHVGTANLLAGGTFSAELGGTTPGNTATDHDLFLVTGTANLNGTLNVSLFGGFMPMAGDSFTILTATTVNGTFTTENLPDISPLVFVVNYNATDVTLTVESAPVANDDMFVTDEDTMLNVAAPGVLANDTDADGDPLMVDLASVVPPALGTLNIMADGSFTYDPDHDFLADGELQDETFTYQATDGTFNSNTATVTITVTGLNDPPVAVDDMFTVVENSMNNILDVRANDTDPDTSDVLTIIAVGATDQGGTATTDGATITYTPAMDFTGMETFTYTINDGNGGTDTATVTVNVVANFPPNAVDDMATTNEDTAVIINVLANDDDGGDGGPLSVTMVTAPANGMAVINMDNTITYTPDPDFNGMDTFDYTVSDTFTTDVGTVTVTINAVNDAPSFTDAGDVTVDEDMGPYTIAGWATNILPGPATAADEAGQGLAFIVTGNTNPALFSAGPAVDSTTGDLTFSTPADAFGSADITLVLMDDGGTANGGVDTSASSTFTITVNNINDPPVITAGPTSNPVSPIPGNTSTGANVAFSITVTDADNDPLTFSWTGACGASAVEDPTLACPFGVGLSVDVTVDDGNGGMDMGNIVVDVTDYTIAANCTSGMPPCNSATMATIAAGQAVDFDLTAMGINGDYAANITYSCQNLPAFTTCTFTPSASVASAPTGGVTTMLRILTTAPGFAQLHAPAGQAQQPPFLALFLTVPGLALFGLVLAGGRRKRRSLGTLCLLAILLLMATALVGCGSGGDFFSSLGSPGTPTGSHSVTINAQGAGTLQRSVMITVVVQ